MSNATRLTATSVGCYAGLLGLLHGIFEIRQGHLATEGLGISAIGPPCEPAAVSHACWPAVTLLPTFLLTGIAAIVVAVVIIGWSILFIDRRRGGVLVMLAVLLLLAGGGILPAVHGVIAGVTAWRIDKPRRDARPWLAGIWPWPLVVYLAWAPLELLIGRLADGFLQANGALILLLSMLLLIVSVVSAVAHDSQHAACVLEKST